MTTNSRAIISKASAVTINLWIKRGLESLWLLMVVLVPLAFFSRDYAVSEAVIAYVEVPKVALLRALTALMAFLLLVEWAITGMQLNSSVLGWDFDKIRPSAWIPQLAHWLRASPGNWVVLAASFFLTTTLLSTALSGSIAVSVWGEIPGQDGYSAYTIAAYLVAFGTIATHLRTQPQLWRLMGAIVAMGTLVAGHGVLQHYGVDPFELIEDTGGGVRRVSSFMGNTIFAAAVMSMTIPITLVVATATVRDPVWSADSIRLRTRQFLQELGLRAAWGLILAVQLLGIIFTLSRGPWIGTATSLAIFAGLVLLFLGWRTFWRAAVVLGLASAFALGFLQSLGSIFILGQTGWFGAILVLLAIAGIAVVISNWRYMGRAVIGVGLLAVLIAGVALGPSWLGKAGSDLSTDRGQPVSNQQTTAGQVSERFSSISSDVRGGLIGGRGTHWRVSWELIRDHPWFEFDTLNVRWLRPLVGYGPDLFR